MIQKNWRAQYCVRFAVFFRGWNDLQNALGFAILMSRFQRKRRKLYRGALKICGNHINIR